MKCQALFSLKMIKIMTLLSATNLQEALRAK